MRSLALPSWRQNRLVWGLGIAALLLLTGFNWPLLAARGYLNLAALSLSNALATNQVQFLSQAEAYAHQAVIYEPQITGGVVYRLGIAKAGLGLAEDAAVDFQAALESEDVSNSIKADLLARLGTYYYNNAMGEQATAYFKRLLEMDTSQLPAETVAYADIYLGELLGGQSGDLFLQRQYFDKGLALWLDAFTMGSYLKLIGQMRQHGGKEYLDQALEMAIIATNRQPSSTWTALVRCNVQLDRQELVEAVMWCQRARDLDPQNHHAHVWLGIAYQQQGLWAEALSEFERAATLTTDNQWYLNLAEAARRKVAGE